MKNVPIEEVPVKISNRKALLFCEELYSLYRSKRFDQKYYRSRSASTTTKKDFRVNGTKYYRPWQFYQSRRMKHEHNINT